jgi:hypothetical protein
VFLKKRTKAKESSTNSKTPAIVWSKTKVKNVRLDISSVLCVPRNVSGREGDCHIISEKTLSLSRSHRTIRHAVGLAEGRDNRGIPIALNAAQSAKNSRTGSAAGGLTEKPLNVGFSVALLCLKIGVFEAEKREKI